MRMLSDACCVPSWCRLPSKSTHAVHFGTVQVMRRYHIQDRDDYKKYNKLCGMVTKVTSIIKKLDARDATRIELTDQLLDKCELVL